MKTVKFKSDFYRGREVVLIYTDIMEEIKSFIQTTFGELYWDHEKKVWFIDYHPHILDLFFGKYKGKIYFDYKELKRRSSFKEKINSQKSLSKKSELGPPSLEQIKALEMFRRYMISNRNSPNTVNTYCDSMKTFFRFYNNKPINEISNDDITRFNVEYIIKNGLSNSFQNQVINALKYFYRIYNGSKIEIDEIERPRREHKLPNVLSKAEVKKIIDSLTNIKHRMMISLIYACGLRRSELLNLKFNDINSDRNLLFIAQSKGNKDRIVPIGEGLIESLRDYYRDYRPEKWLFEGQKKGTRYSEKSLESVLKKAISIAGIDKPVTLHWLRHSYATHLLENGTDLRYIQELLGHKSSRTTEVYTHVSQRNIQQIRSPFDDL